MSIDYREELETEDALLSNVSFGETPFASRVVGVAADRPASCLDGLPDALESAAPALHGAVQGVGLYLWAMCAAFLLLGGWLLTQADFRHQLAMCLGW